MAKDYAQLLRAGSFTPTPWKNGGGTTRELAIYPLGASLEKNDFLWRISRAEVKQPGPFSAFPGYQRLLTLTEGKELVLKSKDELLALPKGKVLDFSGSESFSAELPHGPVADLGVIYRPQAVKVSMNHLEFQKRPRSFTLPPATNFFVALEGEFSVEVYPGELKFPMVPGDLLRIDPLPPEDRSERLVLLQPNAKGGRLVGIEIVPILRN